MVTLKFTVILHSADEGGFTIKCLDIPVASEGETKEEALSNIKEAIAGYLEVKAKLESKTKGEKAEVIVEVKEAIEEVIVEGLPEVAVSNEEKEEIKRSVQKMKKGDCVTLEELKSA